MKQRNWNILMVAVVAAVVTLSFFFFFRIDLTSDKRYSIAPQTKRLMEQLSAPLAVTVYLDGDLNPGFLRLKRATGELLDELNVYAGEPVNVSYENPSLASTQEERQERYAELQERGMTPTAVYERDREGKAIQKIVFPWAEIHYRGKSCVVNLLKNIPGKSGEQNLNSSIETLEFELTDAIRRLTSEEVNKIAFIEGHGELSEEDTYDISLSLSKYFQIDRGELGHDASALNQYKVIIIASPQQPFTETEKYIIDQYIMHGGRVLWLLEGVRLARENLSTSGQSPAIELDVNLKDMLFRYGARISPVVLQDVQSVNIPVNIAPAGEQPQFEPMPWVYAPLLLTSYAHPVTRNLTEVKAEFCSRVEPVGEHPQLTSALLLATSNNTHIMGTPGSIDLNNLPDTRDTDYFNTGYVPVAMALEGVFPSVFANRMVPQGIVNPLPRKAESVKTRQIIVTDGDIIRNEVIDGKAVPLGLDRFTNRQFGNKDFIQNAVLYLADRDGWMDLRSRTIQLSLLNKKATQDDKTYWQMINLVLPLVILSVFGVVYQTVRKRRYR